jgi:pantoate--beta-alanine ligase
MKVARTIGTVRKLVKAARSKGKRIGLVPTMGALHIGHISLIRRAKKQTDFVVVSIFVNPAQFGPSEDFKKYPRPIKKDLAICRRADVDVVFAPSAKEMYRRGNLTWVNVVKLAEPLCGRFRPGHFRGVATVCAKLFNIVVPDTAFFGQKDAQQVVVIKRMVADLNMPLKIAVCPTVREPSGLAVSSRNQYLSEQEKRGAVYIYKALKQARSLIKTGTTKSETIIREMKKIIKHMPATKIEYISIVDAETLQELEKTTGRVLLIAAAVKIGSTRLIDNILLDVKRR